MKRLKEKLESIHKKPYGFYKGLKGTYNYVDFSIVFEHIQGDPYANPSNVCISIPFEKSGFPEEWLEDKECQIALGDFLCRILSKAFSNGPQFDCTGNGGKFFVSEPGQQILSRSAVRFYKKKIYVRIRLGLPAHFRKIDGESALEMLCVILPDILQNNLYYQPWFAEDLKKHIAVFKKQRELRKWVEESQYIAFVPNGAVLPRESGLSDLPMNSNQAQPFKSPTNMEVEYTFSDGGKISGMAIKKGISLIVGGGFHGKSTLLEALKYGIYSHIEGDGREFVISDRSSVSIRAENGRVVNNVNISPFIHNLPSGQQTENFSTENASGSTSQAASIVEAISAGAKVLMMDEDTCATNFMFRDSVMRALIADENEPISPFIDSINNLYQDLGVSVILVMGGVGAYFNKAHLVLGMNEFQPEDLTQKARNIVKQYDDSEIENVKNWSNAPFEENRLVEPQAKLFGNDKVKVKVRSDKIEVGKLSIPIWALDQLVHEDQLRCLGYSIMESFHHEKMILEKSLHRPMPEPENHDFGMINPYRGDLAEVRGLDLWCVLNRAPKIIFKKGRT